MKIQSFLRLLLSTMFALMTASSAHSQGSSNGGHGYYAEVVDVAYFSSDLPSLPKPKDPGPLSPGEMELTATPASDWNLVLNNVPTPADLIPTARAIPRAAENNWMNLRGWTKPERVLYTISVKNSFGREVVRATYSIEVVTGGNLSGKGKFIAQLKVVPVDFKVRGLLHHRFTLSWSLFEALIGGTPDDPIPQFMFSVSYTVDDTRAGSQEFVLDGAGTLLDLTRQKIVLKAKP